MTSDLDRLSAVLADRYRLERELGRGGMATVFLAEDVKHHRPVALKVLKPDLAAALGPDRFLREIELSAGLTHPHILPLHDSGDADGILYYVMPYVEGESLRQRLTREKQLPLEDALQISREVADALSFAHSRGVIHRDIKPENILLEAGHAVVADFGIARAIDAAGGEQLTETGVTLGTPQYMSPEQAAGSHELDGRSDLYSLGCVLYEMLAGQPPFTGPTIESIVAQHLSAPVPDVTVIRPSVPSWVVSALQRSLAKTPADRFNPVAQFGEAIAPRVSVAETPATGASPGSRSGRWLGWAAGIAVAALVLSLVIWGPLGPLVGGGSADTLPAARPWLMVADFDGTADLSYRQAARDLVRAVFDQSTVAAALPTDQVRLGLELAGKPETTTVTEPVARELAVRGSIGSVVTGQLDRIGSSYSILLRLVRAETGEVLAAENRTAETDDALIPALEGAVRALRSQLGERRVNLEASRPVPQVMTPSFAAFRKYAEARRLRYDDGDYRGSADRLTEAIALDPDFASAWALLAANLIQDLGEPDSGRAALAAALERPHRLTRAERLRWEGFEARQRWHLYTALNSYDQWVRERPNDAAAWNIRGIALHYLLGPEAMLEALDHIRTFEPFDSHIRAYNRMYVLLMLGRRDEARQAAPTLRNERERFALLLQAAVLDGAWAEMDSLLPLYERARMAERRPPAAWWRLVRHLSRGEVREAQQLRAAGSRWFLWELAAGAPITRLADTSWEEAFAAAVAGDTLATRAALPRLTADSLDYRVQSGHWRAAIEVGMAAAREEWTDAVQRAGPLLREQPPTGTVLGPGVAWLAARAYEQLGRLDSASVLLAALVEPRRLTGPSLDGPSYGAANSYLRQHLIVLLARQGRLEEARRHWDIFRATFTNPDPEYAHLIDEAHEAVQAAEAIARRR